MSRCAKCRCAPAMTWFVPTIVWEHYISPEHRHGILCFTCWKELTTRRDNRAFEAAHGRPLGAEGGSVPNQLAALVIEREDSRLRRQGLLALNQPGLRHFQIRSLAADYPERLQIAEKRNPNGGRPSILITGQKAAL